MRLDVFRKVIGAHKLLTALLTLESFLSRVSPTMPLQFVRSGESFAAEQPVTHKRSFTGMPSEQNKKMY